jgi:cytochrome P450
VVEHVPEIEFEPFEDRPESPYEVLSDLRAACPVAKVPSGFYYLARYDDCVAAFRDWRTFANAGGMRLPGVVVPDEEKFINEKDGEEHLRLRKLLQTALTPAKVNATKPFIEELAGELARDAVTKGTVDLVTDFAEPIPGKVFNYLVGIPLDEQKQFTMWVDEVTNGPYPATNRGHNGKEGLKEGYPEFSAYVDNLVHERRESDDPPDDLITRMVQTEADGHRMSDTEIRTALIHLITAGNETTANTLGNLLHRLAAGEDLYARLRADRSLIAPAIEESLRLDATTQLLTRSCTRDVDIEGVTIPAGERVIVGIASANRDESAFPDAEAFDVDRVDPPVQLTFGLGAHFCLGAPLARLEIETAVNVLMDHVERMRLAPDFTLDRNDAFWTYGLKHLNVVVEGGKEAEEGG